MVKKEPTEFVAVYLRTQSASSQTLLRNYEALKTKMRIEEIRVRTAGIQSSIRNAFISFEEMTLSVVRIRADKGGHPLYGYGFCSNGRYSQDEIISKRFAPRILSAPPDILLDEDGVPDPFRIWDVFMQNEKPGGHGDRAVAAGALYMAVWDLTSKIREMPLWCLLSENYNGGKSDEEVLVYPGGGYYYPGKEIKGLQDEFRGYLDQGYRYLKMKIGGESLNTDMKRIEAAARVMEGPEFLAVDANARFNLNKAKEYGRAMEPLRLFWYEEPLDPEDFDGHARLVESYEPSLATGENLFSRHSVRNLLRHGGLRSDRDWIQLDPALAYGLTEYLRVIELVEEHGWSRKRLIPHGGHQLSLNIAAGLQTGGSESYPGVFQPFGGFADDIPVINGYTRPHDTPGLGIERKRELHEKILELMD